MQGSRHDLRHERTSLSNSWDSSFDDLLPSDFDDELWVEVDVGKPTSSSPNNSMVEPNRTNCCRGQKDREGTDFDLEPYGSLQPTQEDTLLRHPVSEYVRTWSLGDSSYVPYRGMTPDMRSIAGGGQEHRTIHTWGSSSFGSIHTEKRCGSLERSDNDEAFPYSLWHTDPENLYTRFDSTDFTMSPSTWWPYSAPVQLSAMPGSESQSWSHIGSWIEDHDTAPGINVVQTTTGSSAEGSTTRSSTLPVDTTGGNDQLLQYTLPTFSRSQCSTPSQYDHNFSHVSKQKYVCDQCSKLFNHRRDLSRHIRIHASSDTDTKRYYCTVSICAYANTGFLRKDKLTSHLNTVHGDVSRQFPCKWNGCDSKGFKTPHDLKRHEATKHGKAEAYFRCAFVDCRKKDKVWKRRDNLESHVKKQHDVKDAKALIQRSNVPIKDEVQTDKNGTSTSCFQLSASEPN